MAYLCAMRQACIFLFILLPVLLFCQTSVSPEYKLKKNEELLGCYALCNGTCIHKQSNGKEVLTRLDEKGFATANAELENGTRKFRGKKAIYKKLYHMNGKLMALYECKMAKEDALYVLAEQLDPLTLLPKDSLHPVIALRNTNKYTVTLSEKGSKMLVHAHYQLFLEKNDRKIMHNDVAVMDDNLNLIYTKHGPVPSGKGGEKFMWEDNAVDEEGNVAVLVLEERLSSVYGMNNVAIIYSFSKNEERALEFIPVFPDEKRISAALEIACYPEGGWYLVGYYAEGFNGGAAGTYFLSPGKNNNAPVFNPFPVSYIGENANDKYKLWLSQAEPRGKAPGIPDLVFKKVIPAADGKLLLIAEQELMQHYTFYNKEANPDATWSNLFPNDPTQVNMRQTHIAVTCINANGKAEWNTWIQKSQDEFTFGATYCSFVSALSNNKLFFFFNDHPLNQQPGADLKFTVASPSWDTTAVTSIAELDMQGNQQRKRFLTEPAISSMNIVPDLSKANCNGSVLLIYRDRGGKYRMVNTKIN